MKGLAMYLSHNLSLRQKLALFWPRVSRFWEALAAIALPCVYWALSLFFDNTLVHIIRLFDVHGWLSSNGAEGLSTWSSFVISTVIVVTFFAVYMGPLVLQDADDEKPSQPFKLRLFVLPKKIYSLKMWIAEAPYTGVFILFVVLWLSFYGWYLGQSNLSHREMILARLPILLLGPAYVFCVLAQGYRDFFNNNEWALEAVSKQHAPMPPPISIGKILVITTMVTIGIALVVEAFVIIYAYWF